MKQSAYDRAKDAKTADYAGPDKTLMCAAHGCPNLWSADIDGRLCRWHRSAPKEHWPQVTQEMQWEVTERARLRSIPEELPSMTLAQKRAIMKRLGAVLEPKDPRSWIGILVARRDAGERLSPMQKHALREVGR